LASGQDFVAKEPQADTPTDVLKKLLLAGEKARAVFKHFDSGNVYAPTQAERAHEPMSARVDALCCFEYALESPPPSSTTRKWTPKSAHWMKSFLKMEWYSKLFPKECSESKELEQEGEEGEYEEDMEGETEALKEPETSQGPHTGHLICHRVTDRLPVYSRLGLPGSKTKFPKIYVPSLFAEYKKNNTSIRQAFNQAMLYCSYGVNFLFGLGITDEPVWGLVGAGTEGTIIMAWMSTRSLAKTMDLEKGVCAEYLTFKFWLTSVKNYTFVIDSYTRSFDLTQPLQVLQFMTSISRIYKRREDLLKKLKERLDPSIFVNPPTWMQELMPKRTKRKKDQR